MWGLKFQIVSRPHIPVLLFWQVTETDRAKAGGDMRERHTHTHTETQNAVSVSFSHKQSCGTF